MLNFSTPGRGVCYTLYYSFCTGDGTFTSAFGTVNDWKDYCKNATEVKGPLGTMSLLVVCELSCSARAVSESSRSRSRYVWCTVFNKFMLEMRHSASVYPNSGEKKPHSPVAVQPRVNSEYNFCGFIAFIYAR